MELNAFISKLTTLRLVCEEIREQVGEVDCTDSVKEYLDLELGYIENRIMGLEDAEETDADEDADTEEMDDWWDGLDLETKCEKSNVPMPTGDYGRGDDYFEAEEWADRWWESRTAKQKREIREEDEEYDDDMYDLYEECHRP